MEPDRFNPRKGTRAYTMVELLIATSILSAGVLAVAWSHIAGLKLHSRIATRLEAISYERKLWAYFNTDLKEAQRIQIGSISSGVFTEVSPNNARTGSALQIYPSASDTNNFIRYFVDTPSASLKRFLNTNKTIVTVASFLQNAAPFQFEDRSGLVLTNNEPMFVVAINLSYSQFQHNKEKIGSNNYYKSFAHSRRIAHKRIY